MTPDSPPGPHQDPSVGEVVVGNARAMHHLWEVRRSVGLHELTLTPAVRPWTAGTLERERMSDVAGPDPSAHHRFVHRSSACSSTAGTAGAPCRSSPDRRVPGAGKSTVAASVAQHSSTAACVEADWFWTTIVGRFIDPWLPEADAQNRTVLRSAFYAARAFEDGGCDTVVEGIVGPWMLDVVADTLRDSSPVDYVVLRPSLTSCLSRAARRPAVERVPGHPPLDRSGPIRHMWARFSDLGRLESHAVDTSTMSEDETVRAVLEARHDGRLRVELPTPRS